MSEIDFNQMDVYEQIRIGLWNSTLNAAGGIGEGEGAADYVLKKVGPYLVKAKQERASLRARLEAVRAAATECADDLEAMVKAEYAGTLEYPTMMRDFECDMAPVVRLRAALAALEAPHA